MKKFIIGFLIAIVSTSISYKTPAMAAPSGEVLISVQDSTTTGSLIRARRVKDAGNIADNQTSGLLATGLMYFDGTDWDKATGSALGLDVNIAGITGALTMIGDNTPADAYANPTDAVDASALLSIYNGTTWDRVRGDITNGIDVDVTRLNDGGNSITVDGVIQNANNTLTFPGTAQLIAVSTAQNSADISCSSSDSNIVIKVTYSATNVTAPFRIALKDSGTTYTYSAQITPANTAIVDGSRYEGEAIIVPSYGAGNFQIRLDAVPASSGNVSVFGDCV